jgi:hypothetical protein
MTKTSFCFALALLAVPAVACSSSSRERIAGVGQRVGSQDPGYTGFHGHILPPVNKTAPKNAATVAAAGTLQYYGGKIIPNAKIYSVYWGNAGSYQAKLDPFIQTVPPGPYMAWLSEYDTPMQNLGTGSFAGSFVDTTAPTGTTIDDAQIQSELLSLVAAQSVPPPDGNTLYLFFFPQGLNITAMGSQSCSSFCGYHDTLVSGSQELFYGVLPDPATCGSGCDNQSGNYFADLTSVTTHEITEAVTDPEVGIAIANSEQEGGTYPTFPNGWTSASGEIGDLCAWQNAMVDGYNVQLEWSNAHGGCIAPGSATGDDGGAAEGGDDGGAAEAGDDGGAAEGGDDGGSDASTPTEAGSCDHGVCTTGDALTASCDPCAAQVCAADAYCCTTAWDSICVGEVASYCGTTCP